MKAVVHARSEHPEGASSLRVLRLAAAAFLTKLPRRGELSIIVTTDATIRDLNARFRGKRKATDKRRVGMFFVTIKDKQPFLEALSAFKEKVAEIGS